MKSILFSLILLVTAFPFFTMSPKAADPLDDEPQRDQAQSLVRIYFEDVSHLNQLAIQYDVWEVHHESGYLIALVTPMDILELDSAGIRVEVDKKNTDLLSQPRLLLPGQESGIPGFPCYRTVEETYASLSQLALDFPNLASWVDIGDSWEKTSPGGKNGYDLQTLVLTNKNIPGPKPTFYLMSAIHAREYTTAELATRFAEQLLTNYGIDADITWLLDYYELHLSPFANPDGRKIAEGGSLWRKNTDNDDGCILPLFWGTDLNRNSSFKWGGIGASNNACEETYRGPSAASEPETHAFQNYLANIFPDQRGPGDMDPVAQNATGTFVTLHSYGNQVLFPWGWTASPAPNDTALETLGRKFGYFNEYQVCQSGEIGCIYQTSGSSDDWVYGELGVASYTLELGTAFFESCSYFEQKILPDNLLALLYAFKAARLPYINPAGPDTINLSLSADHIAPGEGLNLFATADDTRYNSAGFGQEPIQSITAARYSLDNPSWAPGTQTFPFTPADGDYDEPIESLSASIDTSALSPGRHIIFVESQDADGNWGVTSAIFLWITAQEFKVVFLPTVNK